MSEAVMEAKKPSEKVSVSLDTANIIIKNLEDKIRQLEIKENNFNAQIHSKKIEFESSKKLEELNLRNDLQKERDKLNSKENSFIAREKDVELREALLKDRILQIEAREADVVDLDKKKAQLNLERSNFNMYKFNIEKELETAKITIEEAKALEEKMKSERDDMTAREIKVVQQERFWNDRIGELEIKEKEIEMLRENLEGLKQAEEIKNGK